MKRLPAEWEDRPVNSPSSNLHGHFSYAFCSFTRFYLISEECRLPNLFQYWVERRVAIDAVITDTEIPDYQRRLTEYNRCESLQSGFPIALQRAFLVHQFSLTRAQTEVALTRWSVYSSIGHTDLTPLSLFCQKQANHIRQRPDAIGSSQVGRGGRVETPYVRYCVFLFLVK